MFWLNPTARACPPVVVRDHRMAKLAQRSNLQARDQKLLQMQTVLQTQASPARWFEILTSAAGLFVNKEIDPMLWRASQRTRPQCPVQSCTPEMRPDQKGASNTDPYAMKSQSAVRYARGKPTWNRTIHSSLNCTLHTAVSTEPSAPPDIYRF